MLGDCCLNGEPSGLGTVRFGEKGTLRKIFTVRTVGAHGGYPHLSQSATKIAAALIQALERLSDLKPDLPDYLERMLQSNRVRTAMDDSLGAGAADVVARLTVNIGVLRGGLKVNVIPDECRVELDCRIPIGLDRAVVQGHIEAILKDFPDVTMEDYSDHSYPASSCDPDGEMSGIIQDNVEALAGYRPVPIFSLGGSDSRYWRWRDIPAYLYGPSPQTMGRRDEHVTIEEFLQVVKTHVLSAHDYLMQGRSAEPN
jgi:succinyl-diaminopimelate desuccinylase